MGESGEHGDGGAREELAGGRLLLDRPAPHVARLTIANPERRGALDHELLDALGEHTRTLRARCLVLRGSGAVFSAASRFTVRTSIERRAGSRTASKRAPQSRSGTYRSRAPGWNGCTDSSIRPTLSSRSAL